MPPRRRSSSIRHTFLWSAADGNSLFATVGQSVDAVTAPGQLGAIYQGSSSPSAGVPIAVDNVVVDDTNIYYFAGNDVMTACR